MTDGDGGVTGSRPACPECGHDELDSSENNDALRGRGGDGFEYFCPACGELFERGEVDA